MNDALSKLNQRQRKFVLEYMRTGNGGQSAIVAGYTKKAADPTASRLLRNVKIQDALISLRETNEKSSILTVQQLREWWSAVINGTVKDVVTVGDMSLESEPTLKDKLKASDLLGKSQGAFIEKIDHTSSDGTMTPTKIERIIVDTKDTDA